MVAALYKSISAPVQSTVRPATTPNRFFRLLPMLMTGNAMVWAV